MATFGISKSKELIVTLKYHYGKKNTLKYLCFLKFHEALKATFRGVTRSSFIKKMFLKI